MPSRKKPFKKISIIGLGLIGSSIALAIKKKKLAEITSGYSRSLKTRTIAKKLKLTSEIKNNISKITNDEVSVNIKEIRKPELDSYLVAENIAQQLEKRVAYRKAMKRAMSSALRLGAKGIKVTVSGRLGGNVLLNFEVD